MSYPSNLLAAWVGVPFSEFSNDVSEKVSSKILLHIDYNLQHQENMDTFQLSDACGFSFILLGQELHPVFGGAILISPRIVYA